MIERRHGFQEHNPLEFGKSIKEMVAWQTQNFSHLLQLHGSSLGEMHFVLGIANQELP